ncbi:MAG: hypothetical protein J6X33_07905 [Clostridiales bacterium]|nr:hypothetical protein [Clostridiales bacterium]
MISKFVFIVNSKARQKEFEAFIAMLNSMSRTHTDVIEIRQTEYAGHAVEIAKEVASRFEGKPEEECDTVVVATGGDGTIHEIANALAGTFVPMGILPLGTGNDFSRTVMDESHRSNKELCVSDILTGNIRIGSCDLIKVESYDTHGTLIPECSAWCNNVASIGFDTDVQAMAKAKVAKNPKSKLVRNTAYMTSALTLLFGDRGHELIYTSNRADGKPAKSEHDRYTMVTVCNGGYYGDGFHPAPRARVSDGLMDISAIRDVPLIRAMGLLGSYKNGKHEKSSAADCFQCTKITVEAPHDKVLLGNYDGEDFSGNRIVFTLVPGSLRLMYYGKQG